MLKEGMYVRCPIDELENPRSFICGQIAEVDEFTEVAKVEFRDPFEFRKYYENIPLVANLNFAQIRHCGICIDCMVSYKGKKYIVVAREQMEGWFYYTIQKEAEGVWLKVKEDGIIASFLSGQISPAEQLRNYEFQNPAWYFGRYVVSKTTKILDSSVFGFKELAGCKIFLMPHQLRTIMRCLQEGNCRYMLADEVGMGKTVEAASVLKIYLLHNANKKVLIAVPRPLLEQWKTELFFKFEILLGEDMNGNCVELISSDEIEKYNAVAWDFVVVDEVHKLLNNPILYEQYHILSREAKNILLLSATPVQQRKEAYLLLLRLIMPNKYDDISIADFEMLAEKQESIRKNIYLVLQNYDDYVERLDDLIDEEKDPKKDDECKDLFDDIVSGLKKVNRIINDEIIAKIISEIEFDNDNCGKAKIQEAFLYICDNYQLEKSIIRNRRSYMSSDLAKRTIKEIGYQLNPLKNMYEYTTYDIIVDWITSQDLAVKDFEEIYIPLLMAFFSSPWAFGAELAKLESKGLEIYRELKENANKWLLAEEDMVKNLDEVLAESYDDYSSRIFNIIDFIDQEISGQKTVLFTNYEETFEKYSIILREYFGADKLALFNKRMSSDELEFNVYQFQDDDNPCFMILCDKTGGEGRNLQSADFIIHIDLPWDANAIEQRIGRLDRLGREPGRDVCSVIPYAEKTLEEELFNFWNEGLNIFKQSLSGLEIIMGDINENLIKAMIGDFRYGIPDAIAQTIDLTKRMKKEVQEEQHFDTAAFIYASMNQELTRLLKYYNENENELFANAMMGWANLAGLKGVISKNNIVRFDDHSFSLKSAENSLLIPPNWMEYINKSSNAFSRKIRKMYEERAASRPLQNAREIVGTFKRDVAIENDYLHFFAPGDDIFDCIVDNAVHSYKGTCAAFVIQSDFDWKGFVFTWILRPNEKLLLEKEVPLGALRQYKNYISIDQIPTMVSLPAYESVDGRKVAKLLERYAALSIGGIKDEVVHMGRRSKRGDLLYIRERYGCSNIDWFKKKYPEKQWVNLVNNAVKLGKEQAKAKFSRGNNMKLAINDINRTLNAEIAHARFFGIDPSEIERKREMYDIVIQALKTSRLEMESAAFVWVRKI